MEKEIMIDTQCFTVLCAQFDPKLLLSVTDCEKCESHGGIEEAWPGEMVEGNPRPQVVKRTSAEMSLEPVKDTIKVRQYNIICCLPMKQRVGIFAKFPDKEK